MKWTLFSGRAKKIRGTKVSFQRSLLPSVTECRQAAEFVWLAKMSYVQPNFGMMIPNSEHISQKDERERELKRELKPPTRGDFAIFNLYVYVVFMWCLWGYEIYKITICLTTNNNIKRKIRLVHQSARTTSPKEKMLWP
jgi:hypothetical protein